MANWSDLPQDVLVSIANLMVLLDDFIAFGLVCKAWRLAAAKENFTGGLTHQVPLLLLYPRDNNIAANSVGEFYNLRKRKIRSLSLAEAKRSDVHSSSLGWLITVSEDFEVTLLHPLDHHPIVKLPNFMMYKHYGDKDYHIRENRVILNKFALSSSPSSTSDYVVMAVYNWGGLAFCRPGDDEWTMVQETNENYTFYCDIAYYKGQFYIVDNCGRVLVCHIEDTEQARIRVIIGQSVPLKLGHHVGDYSLVESRGVLLAVQHVYVFKDRFQGDAIEFRVFEVPFSSGNWSDSEVTNLGNRTLFLGPSSSFSIEASTDCSCEKNCIYYTNNTIQSFRRKIVRDFGIFTMADKIISTYMGEYSLLYSPHLWIQPSF